MQRLAPVLTTYADSWVTAQRSACLAHKRGEVTTRLYERSLACIVGARAAFSTVVDVLGRAAVESYPQAVATARSLPDAGRCMIDAVDSNVEPPPRETADVVNALQQWAFKPPMLKKKPVLVRAMRGVTFRDVP